MFRRLSASLPKDPKFPADLEKLGYFIDDNDQIKKIEYPDEYFQFRITNNERYNMVQREAMHTCIRHEVIKRMIDLGVPPLYLPQATIIKPKAPHIPILATPAAQLRQKRRVLVLVNDPVQDLGIWAYRDLSRTSGIDGGSVVSTIKEVLKRSAEATPQSSNSSDHTPGIVVLNPGQLLYSHEFNLAMTTVTWSSLPRKSAAHPARRTDPTHNRVAGHETAEAHITSVFEAVLANPAFVCADAKICIIACGAGGGELLKYLSGNWHRWCNRISAIALTQPYFSPPYTSTTISNSTTTTSNTTKTTNTATTNTFPTFLAHRTRAWSVSPEPINTPLANASTSMNELTAAAEAEAAPAPAPAPAEAAATPYPRVSSGVADYAECIMPAAQGAVLAWLDEVAEAGEGYRNPWFEVVVREEEAVVRLEEGPW